MYIRQQLWWAAMTGGHTHRHTHTKTLKRWTAQPGLTTAGALCVIYMLCYNTSRSELLISRTICLHILLSVKTLGRSFAYMEWMMTLTLYVHKKAWLRLRLIDSSIMWKGFTSFPGAHCDPRHYDHGGSASIWGCWLRINPPLQWPGYPQGSPTSLALLPPQHTHAISWKHFLLDWINTTKYKEWLGKYYWQYLA